jgi:dCMP deaminase
MEIAETVSKMSYAKRLQVGAVIVKNDNVISFSWNGTPSLWDNNCESKEWMPEGCLHPDEYPEEEYSDYGYAVVGKYRLKTKPEVIHAEANSIMKLARSNESGNGATMFLTHAPCMDCAKLIYGAGIINVFYKNEYRDNAGVKFLEKCGVYTYLLNSD